MTTLSSPRSDTAASTGRDTARQVVVAVSAVLAVVGSAIGSGAFGGTPVQEAGGGVFSAEATLAAPDGPAFAIWSVVYLGLIALAGWQLAPARRADPRQRATGWLVAASMLLNAAWLFVVQAGAVLASVAVIAVLLAVLVTVFVRLLRTPPTSTVEGVVVDGTMHVYLGWVCVATVANTASAFVHAGAAPYGGAAQGWAVAVLVVAAAVGVGLAMVGRGRLGVGAALAWGLAWAAAGRRSGPDASDVVLAAAALAATTVLVATVAARLRAGWSSSDPAQL